MNWRERYDDGDDHNLELSLSLTLKCPSQKSPQHKPSFNGSAFDQSSSASIPNSLRGFDVNKLGVVVSTEPPPLSTMSSSPDSTISSTNGKRSEREETGSEQHTANSEGGGDDDSSARKKLRLSKEQALVLEETFKHQCTLNQNQKVALARQLNLQTRQVEVWFQNRRARTKFTKTEVDCAYLKKRCEDLTEENRRLQKEVAELRALKYSPQMKPPTTLSMCPQCERVAMLPKSSPATSSTPGTNISHHIIKSGLQDHKSTVASHWLTNTLQETSRPRQ